MAEKTPMTVQGKQQLEDELKQLKNEERPNVIQAIEEARAHGDLSENAEYDAAKERQSFIEGRINEVNAKLTQAEVIDPSELNTDKIVFGATVKLEDGDSGEEVCYQIVGEDEANIKKGKVSVTSPIARALIGKQEGDEVEVHAPKGKKYYEVIEIRYE